VEKQLSVQENEIPEALKIVIYRILQEALNNVAKYSEADLVRLSLRKRKDSIELAIEDNGRGFEPGQIHGKDRGMGGMGLAGMEERTELSGGTFELKSGIGKGTSIRTSWPLDRKEGKAESNKDV
jgi:signal transduction histidine kinase